VIIEVGIHLIIYAIQINWVNELIFRQFLISTHLDLIYNRTYAWAFMCLKIFFYHVVENINVFFL
jgi:hypothetical protein